MSESFSFDVFLSYSSKDQEIVRAIAERLRADGLRVWLDHSSPAKIEEGLEHSRVLVLCLSANASGSDWTRLESGTFRFRDPLNQERRFIPHPAYTGRLPSNPYTGVLLPYTGATPIRDFVGDHVLPQMQEIIDGYDPDILWCDSAWEQTAAFWQTSAVIARYFNQAERREIPKEVVVNNRCRVTGPDQSPVAADFTTPEYTTLQLCRHQEMGV